MHTILSFSLLSSNSRIRKNGCFYKILKLTFKIVEAYDSTETQIEDSMHLNEVEMADPELSVQELKKQLFTSLQCTGILDSLKSQLRVRLLDHLREQDGTLLQNKDKNRKPSVTERLLGSLFLDYLNSYGYAFTQSVFLPESRMVSWPPYSNQEILQLLHLDSSSTFSPRLKFAPDGKGCLVQQLVMVLQKYSFRIKTNDASIQTQDLDSCLRQIDDECYTKQEAERQLALCSLEDRFNAFRKEFETRVNSEVAFQVNRVREYETNALRMEEACRYRRQLSRDREELEELHKARLERIREREESLMERLLVKEKAIEASAYEQRQKLLADITNFRDRAEKLQGREELQLRREEKLDEHEKYLKMREEDINHLRETLYARVDESAQMRLKELEDQYRSKNELLQTDRGHMEAKWAEFAEEKARMANELRAAKIDKELVISLHERLAREGEERQFLLEKIENICQEQSRKWNLEQKKMQKTIKKLEAEIKNALEEKEVAIRSRKALQVELRLSESELLDTVTLLKKTQHALELERLHHYSLRSQIATHMCSSQDKLQENQIVTSLTNPQGVDISGAVALNSCNPGGGLRISQSVSSLEGEPSEKLKKSFAEMVARHLSPCENTIRAKVCSLTQTWPDSDKTVLTQEANITSNLSPCERNTEKVRMHQEDNREIAGKKTSLNYPRGEGGDSSGTNICSSSSDKKQMRMPGAQKVEKTSKSCKERADKDYLDSNTSESDSLTSRKSKGAQKSLLPPHNSKKAHEANQQTPSSTPWETNQISTNYFLMGATSLKSSTSSLEFKMIGKAVKLSTSVDSDHNERRHTEVYETKFQQNIQKKSAEADRDPEKWTKEAPEFQDRSLRLLRIQELQTKDQFVSEGDQFSEATFSGEISVAGRENLRGAEFGEQREVNNMRTAEKERLMAYNGTMESSGQSHRDKTRQAFSEQQKVSPFSDADTQKGVASFEQSRLPESSRGESSQNLGRESNPYGLSPSVVEDLKRFSQQLEFNRNLMAINKHNDTDVIEPRIGISGSSMQQHSRVNNDTEPEFSTIKQVLGERTLRDRVNPKYDPVVPADQRENVAELRSFAPSHSRGQDLPVKVVSPKGSTQKTEQGEGADSEESCSNPKVRAPAVRNTPEYSGTPRIAPEAGDNLQEVSHAAEQVTQRWDVQSEQGSHNPEEETMEWIDDYATGDNDHYLDHSDAFSVPESSNTPSNDSAAACSS